MDYSWEDLVFVEGINVECNGHSCAFEVSGELKKYRIGEMLCELTRLDIHTLKALLMNAPRYSEKPDKKKMLETVSWLRGEMRKTYPPVISEMLCIEFLQCIKDYYCDDSGEVMKESIMNLDYLYLCDEFNNIYQGVEMLEYAFMDSGYKRPGSKTVGQLLLTLYLEVNLGYMKTMEVFNTVMDGAKGDPVRENADKIIEMTKKYAHLQEIEYRVLYYGDRYNSVYTIKSMMSLCLFELAHIYDGNVPIVRCKNCGHWFVPRNRSDTKYCNYPAPGNPERTCKEIGAQKAWAAKEKTDDVTRAYRKVYMRYKMAVSRHPYNEETRWRLELLTEGIKEWRRKLAIGEAEKDEFMDWLAGF